MRRSIRDALVGFSILGGVIGFCGSIFWLQGVNFRSKSWHISAHFEDATGLAERSPVTYRGIFVGSIGKILVGQESVKVKLNINKPNLQLPKPVFAKIANSSLLGGDVQISLISFGGKVDPNTPLPRSKKCPSNQILCHGDEIKGEPLVSISTLTEEFQKIIQKAEKQDIVASLADSTKQFDLTQKNLDELIAQVKIEIIRAEPFITNLNQASSHLRNILDALDNPETLEDLKRTAHSARSLTDKIDKLGIDFENIRKDDELISALRRVTIGLGELFNELYPERKR